MKTLIAIDDSACSAVAIQSIIDREYNDFSGEIRVVTAIEPIAYEYTVTGIYFESFGEAQREMHESRKALLEKNVEALLHAFPKAKITAATLDGPAAESIVEEAKRWKADLVVVGSHGRSGFEHFLLGSVAEKVVNNAPCSVQVVKQKKPATTEKSKKTEEPEALAL